MLSIEDVGTDLNAAQNFDALVGEVPFHVRSAEVLAGIKQVYMDAHPDRTDLEFGREPVVWRSPLSDPAMQPGVYPALPLDGIWARAPYLHNNSVSSLHDLLLPSEQRPKSTLVGSRNYNPNVVGFSQEDDPERSFLIDTSKPGNSNSGHDYGTELDDDDKQSLLEYMKTL